jgi:hypothetical protein
VDLGHLPVVCLNVSGNRAGIVLRLPVTNPPIPAGALLTVEDNPGSLDGLSWRFVDVLPTACLPSAGELEPILRGDIVVTDAQPLPTSKDQCKSGGWRRFPQFKNQGACVSFVAHQPREP